MRTEILNILQQYAEEKYRNFSAKLLPKNCKVFGVRIPILRKIAKQMTQDKSNESYLKLSPALLEYQEELILYAILIAMQKNTEEIKIQQIKKFIPYINSWAVCDIFCSELKLVKRYPDKYFTEFNIYAQSNEEYQIRFFYVLALNYFITDNLLPLLKQLITTQKYVGYYDKMAVAWFLSISYIKFSAETECFILNSISDKFIFQKTISKINDSLRVTKEAKAHLKSLASNKRYS